MTDLPNIIVSMCLVSYNFCMIPHVLTVTFGLNLSGAWGGIGSTPSLSAIYCLHRAGQGAGPQLPSLPPAPGAAQRGVRHRRGGARHAAARQQVTYIIDKIDEILDR